jgi:hypothetical protein
MRDANLYLPSLCKIGWNWDKQFLTIQTVCLSAKTVKALSIIIRASLLVLEGFKMREQYVKFEASELGNSNIQIRKS